MRPRARGAKLPRLWLSDKTIPSAGELRRRRHCVRKLTC